MLDCDDYRFVVVAFLASSAKEGLKDGEEKKGEIISLNFFINCRFSTHTISNQGRREQEIFSAAFKYLPTGVNPFFPFKLCHMCVANKKNFLLKVKHKKKRDNSKLARARLSKGANEIKN